MKERRGLTGWFWFLSAASAFNAIAVIGLVSTDEPWGVGAVLSVVCAAFATYEFRAPRRPSGE